MTETADLADDIGNYDYIEVEVIDAADSSTGRILRFSNRNVGEIEFDLMSLYYGSGTNFYRRLRLAGTTATITGTYNEGFIGSVVGYKI